MTIEEKPGICQENKEHYSKIEKLVDYISKNMKVVNKIGNVTNKRDELIEVMFSYIKEKHSFNKEWYRIELLGEGSIIMNTTYEHKEAYIKLLTEEIENYVELVKNNKNKIRRNYVELVKNNNGITKEKLYELLNKKNLDRLGDEFIVDLGAVEKRVKEAFYSSIKEEIVQQSYIMKIDIDPCLSEQAMKVSETRRKKTAARVKALEINKKRNNSLFSKVL